MRERKKKKKPLKKKKKKGQNFPIFLCLFRMRPEFFLLPFISQNVFEFLYVSPPLQGAEFRVVTIYGGQTQDALLLLKERKDITGRAVM